MRYSKVKLMVWLGMALAPFFAQGQVTFTVNATVNSTGGGFTAGEAVSFTFTLAQSASNTGSASAATGGTDYKWEDDLTTDPILWSNVTATPFTGTYVRPTDTLNSPEMRIQVTNAGDLILLASSEDYVESMGLSYGGNAGTWIFIQARYTGLSFDTSNGTLPDATTYFSALTGTYSYQAESVSENTSFYYDGGSDIYITPTSLTIAYTAVPEPSTYAAIAGVVILFGTIAYRRRQAAPTLA